MYYILYKMYHIFYRHLEADVFSYLKLSGTVARCCWDKALERNYDHDTWQLKAQDPPWRDGMCQLKTLQLCMDRQLAHPNILGEQPRTCLAFFWGHVSWKPECLDSPSDCEVSEVLDRSARMAKVSFYLLSLAVHFDGWKNMLIELFQTRLVDWWWATTAFANWFEVSVLWLQCRLLIGMIIIYEIIYEVGLGNPVLNQTCDFSGPGGFWNRNTTWLCWKAGYPESSGWYRQFPIRPLDQYV